MNDVIGWFGDSGRAAFAAFVLSVLAISVSLVAWFTSWKTQRRQVQIEERRERERSVQKQKAALIAKVVREPGSRHPQYSSYFLAIENLGLAEARDISATLDGKDVMEHPVIAGGQQETRQLGPQSAFRYVMAPSISTPTHFAISIAWSDDSGEPGSYRTTLTL